MNQTFCMKFYLTLFFTISSFVLFAQKKEFPLNGTAQAGDYGVTLQMNGFINALNVTPTTDLAGNNQLAMRYFWRDQLAFRLGLGVDGFRNNISRVDSVGNSQVQFDSTSTGFNFYFNPGFEKHFTKYGRLNPFIGTGFNLGILGKTSEKSTRITTDTTGVARREFDGQYPGGFLFGVYSTFGFNYFIAPKLALGVEYNIGLYNRRRGGDYNSVIIDTPISGQANVSRIVGSDFSNQFGVDFSNSAIITLSYFFSKS